MSQHWSTTLTTRIGTRRLWRQLIGCAVAYVLVLQGVLLAASGAQVATTVLSGDQQGVELCLHDAPAAPGSPDRHGDGTSHCPFCLAAAHLFLTAPDTPLGLIVRVTAPAPWLPGQAIVAISIATGAHQPRGPPPVV
jgi:hypothetical protein